MNTNSTAVRNIYFTSWQYVRVGHCNSQAVSAGASGVSWIGPEGRVMRPPCDAVSVPGDDSYLSSTKYLDSEMRFVSYSPRGIRLVAQQPTKIKFSDSLGMDPEGSPVPISIIFDEGRYKCWYAYLPATKPTTEPFHQFNLFLRYAESTDGFHWTKPNLGLFEHEGSRDNNIVLTPYEPYVRSVVCPSVFIDNHCDPAERYKMITWGSFTEEQCVRYRRDHPDHFEKWGFSRGEQGSSFSAGKGGWGLAGAVSADGIHWKLLDEPLNIHFADMLWASMTYDPRRKQYLCYHRTYTTTPSSAEGFGAISRRSVARSTSTDFRRFENTEVLLATSADMSPSHVHYQPCQTWLPGCEGDQQVMFVIRWKQEKDVEDVCLFSTLDGWSWSPVPGGSPILAAGEPGTWDGTYVMTGGYLVELPGDRWALPYMGCPIPHKYPRIEPSKRKLYTGVAADRGYAIWPKGRLVAMECPDVGEFATVAVRPEGDKLFLNAVVEPAGYLKVGLKTVGGDDIPGRTLADCDPIWGTDGLALPVTWKGQDGLPSGGHPVILSFQLCRTKLFGLSFR